jgi:hypothetical protein
MYGSLINVKLAADAAAAPSGVWEVNINRMALTISFIRDPVDAMYATAYLFLILELRSH